MIYHFSGIGSAGYLLNKLEDTIPSIKNARLSCREFLVMT